MRKLLQSVLVVGSLLAGGTAQAAWTNLSFEEGLTGWCTSCSGESTVTFGGTTVLPKSGSLMAEMFATNGNVVLSQIGGSALAAGTTLWYRFQTSDFGNGSGRQSDWLRIEYQKGSNTWLDVFGGAGNQLTSQGQGNGDSLWQSFSLAGATSLRITLHGDNDSNLSWAFVDITPGVPEPGEWAMMLAGLGIVGAMARRRGNKG
jgi:hypothetical protein